MKKFVFSTLFFSLLVLSIGSCKKKDYTCVCRSTVNGNTMSTTTISASSTIKAASDCDEKQAGYVDYKCDIVI